MRFMLKLTLKQPASKEIMALLPAEQARGRELAQSGIQEVVYVAADRSTVWTVWHCDSPETLEDITRTLPLYDFWNIETTKLADEA